MELSADNGAEERIAVLERKMRDMEALVRGLTAEMLDMKSTALAISRQEGERSRQDQKKGTAVQATITPALSGPAAAPAVAEPADDRTVIVSAKTSPKEGPAAVAEPAMVRIMQSDGTMKLEPRYGKKKMF
jgi:hypothetical protein